MISLDEGLAGALDDHAELQQDEEFLLSPSDEMMIEESSDSGSQVIALEESDAFDEGIMEVGDSEEALLEPEEAGELDSPIEFEGAADVETGIVPIGASGDFPEAPYSIWNILSLLLIVMLLSVTGMLMTDVIRNMWAWNGNSDVTSGIANALASMFSMR